MADKIVIRPVGENEREAWNSLWAGYLAFYKTTLTQEVSDLAWDQFHDPDEPIFALGGYVDGDQWELPTTSFIARPGLHTDIAIWKISLSHEPQGGGGWDGR